MINYVQGYDGLFTYKMYEYWMKIYSSDKHKEIINSIERFVKSNEIVMSINHKEKII